MRLCDVVWCAYLCVSGVKSVLLLHVRGGEGLCTSHYLREGRGLCTNQY